MSKTTKGSVWSFYMPGIVLLVVALIILWLLFYIPLYIYLTTICVAFSFYHFILKNESHPLGLTSEEIDDAQRISVCIVGAGFSGICMAIKLKQAGLIFRILEKNSDLGGTWWANRYPGAFCDVWAIVYQFSFHLNPNWSAWLSHAGAPEILSYLKDVASYYKVDKDISFGVTVESAVWNKSSKSWRIETSSGEIISVTHLVSSCGVLQKPHFPDIPGRELFTGPSFHSSAWDDEINLTGKRVALIGSGASGVQIGPAILDKVRSLHVFQRTPNWFIPRAESDMPEWLKTIFRNVPYSMKLLYAVTFCMGELYAKIWLPKGWLSRGFQKNVLEKVIRDQVGERSDLIQKLTPNYEVGCKRIMLSSDFLPMFIEKPDKAHLITDSITEITADAILAGNKRYLVDVIVYATGFEPKKSICGFRTEGRNGAILYDKFEKDPTAYLGITVPNFPNFFLLFGPNTVVAHNSALFMIECQVNYVMKCLKKIIQSGISSIEVKKRPTEKFRQMIDKLTAESNISGSCKSWYRTDGGTNFVLWPTTTFKYWMMTRNVKLLRDYKLTFQ